MNKEKDTMKKNRIQPDNDHKIAQAGCRHDLPRAGC